MPSWRAVWDVDKREFVTSIDTTPAEIEQEIVRLMSSYAMPDKFGPAFRLGVVSACRAFGFDAKGIHERARSFIQPGWDIDGVW